MFSRYAAIVKNLRGIILVESEGEEEALNWLMKRFKYRSLAVPPSMSKLRNRKGFRRLLEAAYPNEGLKKMVEIFAEEFRLPFGVIEAATLASAYVSPILAVGEWASNMLSPLTVGRVDLKKPLDGKGWKLHLRIADYTVLDAYEWSVNHAEKLWLPNLNLKAFQEERTAKVKKDIKRYWRLTEGEGEAKPFLLYVDLAFQASTRSNLLDRLKSLKVEEVSAGLALEAAVLVNRETIGG